MRLPWLPFALLAGCGPGPVGDTADLATPDLVPGECALVKRLVAPSEALPGAKVPLSVEEGASGHAYEVRWTVPKGVLSAPTGPSVTWTPPPSVATHVAEPMMLRAVASAPGCRDETVAAPITIDWPPPHRTVVIYNPKAAGSLEVATHYADFRRIPPDHLCPVAAADPGLLDAAAFPPWLATALGCATTVGPHVHYLVPVFGVPLKVAGRIADIARKTPVTVSLDALLAYGSSAPGLKTVVPNPYYQSADSVAGLFNDHLPFGEFRAMNPDDDYFLVARIDGVDAAAAKKLVDRTAAAEILAAAGKLAGTVYVDGNRGANHPKSDKFGSYEWGEWNILGVETVFKRSGKYPIVADYDSAEFGTAPAPLKCPDALYYAGWYSFGHYNDVFTWRPGAIGGHLDSCSACNIRGITDWSAVALQRGITATFGAVNEPYVAGMPDYDQLFHYLLQGATFGEAGYQSTVYGAWMMVFVGDPLYRPYR